MVRNSETQQVHLVPLEESEGGASPDHEEHGLSSGRQHSPRYGKRESYRLLPEFKAQVLAEVGDLVCTVDLYANRRNNREALYCTPLNPVRGIIGHASDSAEGIHNGLIS